MVAGAVNVKITKPRAFTGASFDGVDDKIITSAKVSENCSFSVWLYYRAINNADRVFDGDSLLNVLSANNQFGFARATTPCLSAVGSLLTKTWFNLIITSTSAGVTNIYINGILSGAADQVTETLPFTNIIIGNRSIGDRAWDGLIKDFKIYNKILSSAEITQLSVGQDVRNGLIGEWKLQSNYLDTSGYGNNGTNSGTSFVNQEDTFRNVLSGQLIVNQLSGSYILSGQYMICGLAGGQICSVALQHT